MKLFKQKFSRLAVIGIFAAIAVAIFIVVYPAWAQEEPSLLGQTVAAGMTGLGDIVRIIVGSLIFLYVHFIGLLLLILIKILVQVASYNDFVNSAVVMSGWTIVRDLSNMFFIIILLAIAFGTILGVEKLDWKQRLPKLLIFAVLINFTRVIAGVVIDFGQVIMITFVNGFKDAAGGNFADLLGIRQLLEISVPGGTGNIEQLQNVAAGNVGGAAIDFIQVIGAMIGAAIFATVSLIVILLIVLVLVYRMVMLWIYVTLSPVAFILGAFPQGESYYADWWKKLVSTVALGPVLAFFLWLSLLTVGQITIVTEQPLATNTGLTESGAILSCGASEACQSDNVLKFIVGIGMLMGGLTVAQGLASSAGEGMGGLVGWARKAGTGAIKRLSGVATVQKARQAFEKKDMQAGGLGGLLARGAVYAQAGFKGVPFLGGVKAQKAVRDYQSVKIKEQKERISTLRDQELLQMRTSGSTYERAAALSVLAERGAVTERNGFTRQEIESARTVFGNATGDYTQFVQATKKSDPALAYNLGNLAERTQFVTDVRRGVARADNLDVRFFQGAEGQEFVRGLSEGQTVEQIRNFYNKLTEDAQDQFLAQIQALTNSGTSTPELRQMHADLTNDIDAAFPQGMPTTDQEIQRWIRRTATSMVANRQATLAQAQARLGGAGGGGPAGGGAAGGVPPPGGAPPPSPVPPVPPVPPVSPPPRPGGAPPPPPITPPPVTPGHTASPTTPPRVPPIPPQPSRPVPQPRSQRSTPPSPTTFGVTTPPPPPAAPGGPTGGVGPVPPGAGGGPTGGVGPIPPGVSNSPKRVSDVYRSSIINDFNKAVKEASMKTGFANLGMIGGVNDVPGTETYEKRGKMVQKGVSSVKNALKGLFENKDLFTQSIQQEIENLKKEADTVVAKGTDATNNDLKDLVKKLEELQKTLV